MLADILKKFRKAHGDISQSDAAIAAGISIDTWRAWEQRRYEPDFDQLGKLLRFLGPYAKPLFDRMGIKHTDEQTPEPSKTHHSVKPK